MKRLWIAAALLIGLFSAMLYNSWYLGRFADEVSQLLTHAETQAEQGAWEQAEALTRQAYDLWESRDTYLHIMLRHADTDQIYAGFREVLEFITCREDGEYSAANARLITQIELLQEAEQLTLKNVL